MRYLTAWRMQLAKEQLRSGHRSIAQVGYEIGYQAEEAFTRAFKREFGIPPAHGGRQSSYWDDRTQEDSAPTCALQIAARRRCIAANRDFMQRP